MESFFFPDPGELADVQSGQPWTPEPAARYNAVNALLRESFRSTPGRNVELPGRECRILCGNTGNSAIPRYAAVVVSNARTLDSGELFCQASLAPVTATSWGIAAEAIPAGGSAPVIFLGPVKVSGVTGTQSTHVSVSSSGQLGFSAGGRAEVLWSDGTGNALLLLGGSSSGYNGQFKVVYRRPGVVAVINGSDPGSATAGYTDLGSVPAQEVSLASLSSSSSHAVCLVAEYTGSPEAASIPANFRLSIAMDASPQLRGLVELARVSDNGRSITQVWQNGSVCWAGRYVL